MNSYSAMTAASGPTGHGMDRAKKPGLRLDALNRFLEDMDQQPGWRYRADREVEYYDGNQLSSKDLADLNERGLPPVVVNLIAPTINVVLGLEAKTRTDWLVRPDDEKSTDIADALNAKLKEAATKTKANRACGDAYGKQIKVGIGWVEVCRNWDPFGYKYRVKSVDHREIWWDWRAKEPDLSDARYLVRRRWYDVDQVKAMFPEQADLIEHAGNGWANWDPTTYQPHQQFAQDNDYERDWGWDEDEWRDIDRERVCLYEVWYRTFERGYVLNLPDGRVVEYDKQNPAHVAAVLSGRVKAREAVLPKMRLSWWMGPHRFHDEPSPLPHNSFPYVPFWGYREDLTGVPYGMIRNMVPLQDEINRRRAKMLWQLSAKQVKVEDDAVHDHGAVQAEIARPDAYIKLNPNRTNKSWSGLEVKNDEGLSAQQFQAYQESKQGLQDSAGVYQEMLGKQGSADSGVAIQTLIEQGTTTLAEINDNYRDGKQTVGEHLLAFLVDDMANEENVDVAVDQGHGRGIKHVILNAPEADPATGLTVLNNDIKRAMLRVELDAIQSTATYRTQVFLRMSEMVKGLPPQLQALVLDMVFEASDFPGKDEVAERIRRATNVVPRDPSVMDDQERADMEKRAQKMAQLEEQEQRRIMLELEDLAADLRSKHADIFETEQKGRKAAADADKSEAEAAAARAQVGLDPDPGHTIGFTDPGEPGTAPGPEQLELMPADAPHAAGETEPFPEPVDASGRVQLNER